jgi:transposase
VRGTRSGNRASRSEAPTYEHPQWYPPVGSTATANASEGGSSVVESYAGLDWAKEEHRLCVLHADGKLLSERRVIHDEGGIASLCASLVELGVRRVAIERPDGLLVERLLEAGLVVLVIHPNQLKAARPRFRSAGGKSDSFDAFCLAELARTDHHRFRALTPDSDETKALKALTRAREDLVRTRIALANRLRAELEASWPGASVIFADLDSPIALAFLERYPSPQDARGLGEKRLSGFLARHGYCGRKQASELLARLRRAPTGTAGELEAEVHRTVVLALVAAPRPLIEQIKLLGSQIAHAVRAHPHGEVFLSLFRNPNSTLTAARLVAEIGDCRERYPSAEALAADAGMSPVAIESGKRKAAAFRRACDKRLRDAVATLANTTRQHHPWAKDVYRRARGRGLDHPHAIRVLGRAWLRVIWRMWQDSVPYDPAKHGGLKRLSTAGG